ncbi:DNA sulfur modification protein DndD [Cellulomonas humilata]|uniref:Nuclease SbcCD subunit C n=2 Tax=Cellulomonas humilata TaxID=144055 RepID=A0ABU0EKZ8_9CELL|nr:DNA sulfur modification protein DndD [Cellulomonas humilata]
MSVTLQFTADEKRYDLHRSASGFVGGAPKQDADLRIDSEAIAGSRIPAEIGNLLHPQIADFFLFDGELLERFFERLRSTDQRREIRNSIDRVLGVPALQRAYDDIAEMTTAASLAAAKSMKAGNERTKVEGDLKRYGDQSASVQKDLEALHAKLGEVKLDHVAKSDELRSVEALKEDAKQLEHLEARLADLKKDDEAGKVALQAFLTDGWFAVAVKGVSEALARARTELEVAELQRDQRDRLLQRIRTLEARIHGGNCETCGQGLPAPDPAVYEERETARAELAALGGTVDVRSIIDRERQLQRVLDERTVKLYRERVNSLQRARLARTETQREIDDINGRLAEHSAPAIRSLAATVEQLRRVQEDLENKIEKRSVDLQVFQAELGRLATRLSRLPSVDPKPAALSAFYGYLGDAFESSIQEYRNNVREAVELDVTAQFKRLIRDPLAYGDVKIGADFDMHLLDPHGRERQTSEGGRQLLALAFIGALKQVAVRGGPVILDSPLGRLDKEHRVNVLRTWIPQLGSQASLFVQSGELTEQEAAKVVGDIVGAEYRLVRPDHDPENVAIQRVERAS